MEYLIRDDRCEFRPSGDHPLAEAVDLFVGAIAYCRQQGVGKLLIDARALGGSMPSRLDRFLIDEELARAAMGRVAVAFLTRAEYIVPEKVGRAVAADMGLFLEAFASMSDALGWLSEVGDRGPSSPEGTSRS